MANNYDLIKIVNAVNKKLGGVYAYTFPIVNNKTFGAMAACYRDMPTLVRNAYNEELYNVVTRTDIKKVYQADNPFKAWYGEEIPMSAEGGSYTREVAVDQFIPLAYDINSTPESFFASAPPKLKVQYMTNMLRKKYVVTMIDELVEAAFVSVEKFRSFWNTVMERMHADMEEDDKEEIMAALAAVVEYGNIYLIPLTRPTDSQTALQFSTFLETQINDMGFKRRRQWNLAHLSTKSNKNDAILVISGDVISTQNRYNLAWALNKTYLELLERGQLIMTDSEGVAANKVYAMYFSKDFIKVNPALGFPKMKYWENGENLEEKWWLHNWKQVVFSFMENAIAFVEKSDIGIGTMTLMTREDATTVKKGKFLEFTLPDVKPTEEGKLFDSFVTYSMVGNAPSGDGVVNGFSDPTTTIDPWSGCLYVGKNETATQATVTGTHHLDDTVTATKVITIS